MKRNKGIWLGVAVLFALCNLPGRLSAASFRNGAVACNGTAQAIGTKTNRDVLLMANTDATLDIYLGDANVSTANGFPLFAHAYAGTGDQQSAWVSSPSPYSDLYCRTAGTTISLRFLEVVR